MAQQFCELLQQSLWACIFLLLLLSFFVSLMVIFWLDWRYRAALRQKERNRIEKIYRRAAKAGVV